MKTLIVIALIAALATPAFAGSTGANPNYGKADDYGSERYAAVNRCMVEITLKAPEALRHLNAATVSWTRHFAQTFDDRAVVDRKERMALCRVHRRR